MTKPSFRSPSLILILAVGCGARTELLLDDPVLDGGPRRDGGAALDASRRDAAGFDAAIRDAGGRRDAGPADAGTPDDPTGVWVGPLAFAGIERTFTFVLHARPGGQVIGYLAGSPPQRVIVAGERLGAEMSLAIELRDPRLVREISVRGIVSFDHFVGTCDAGDGPHTVEWRRDPTVTEDRRFAMWRGGDPSRVVDVAVALRADGSFVSGGYVGQRDCDVLACGGGLTDFEETLEGDEHVVAFSYGPPPTPVGSARARARDIAPLRYFGTYDVTLPDGTVNSGPAELVRSGAAHVEDIREMLAALARIADAQESGPPLDPDALPIARGYLHDGMDRDALVARLDAEAMRLDRSAIAEPRRAVSYIDPLADRSFETPVGLAHRRILSDPDGTPFLDADSEREGDDALRFFARDPAGVWLIVGNGL